jgi:hypothetical protein
MECLKIPLSASSPFMTECGGCPVSDELLSKGAEVVEYVDVLLKSEDFGLGTSWIDCPSGTGLTSFAVKTGSEGFG